VIEDYLKRMRERVEEALARTVPADWPVPDRLCEAVEYSLWAGGKRLRPILCLAAAESVRGEEAAVERALPFAAAVELVHTYSLIHDDLPAMDNDDFRRGKPTNHRVFGEAMAILAGDALLTHAFFVAAQATDAGVPADRTLRVSGELARLAGLAGMVSGQAEDIMEERGVTGPDDLDRIYALKTGALIAFALRAGGHAAGADEAQLDALELYGRKLGLAYQIQDDILDVLGSEDKLGKPTGSDARGQKVTYPYLFGLDESRRRLRQLTEEAREAVLGAGLALPDRLTEIADFLVSRDH
jgi:geranylgeranyl diphosphate synthase type II